ncbi:endolytic transglycosylase MltG [Actinacidiphila acidipaludis]|uniref:Endolytic murein transglycosylase n=1 Tax=Actinacidiphila acidipaludis TaxID=2873382 RepID=A0ABS7QD45_9ACTN|nr:endolytic transglycosylase MltG [Streptomyces acidipaludis]MBY8879887.1 endolytic transglycosylase MltG [Streptomyces acidipaludis]
MTDYGRGSGSDPWHPEDPLFGDVYDQGQGYQQQQHQPQSQQGGWQDPYAQDPYTSGQHPTYPQQGYPQQQYPQGQYGQDQYQQGQPVQQGQQGHYPQEQYQQQPASHPQHPQHPQQQSYGQTAYDPYDTGSYSTGGYGNQDPYGGQQAHDPYGNGQRPDYYGQNGYPPPQQPQFRGQPQPGMQQGMGGPGQMGQPGQGGQPAGPGQPGAGPQGLRQPGQPGQGGRPTEPEQTPLRTAPEKTGTWDDDEADPREHAFFAGRDDDDDDDELPSSSGGRRTGRSSGKEGPRKRRSGCACLVVATLLVGAVGGAGYYGYTFYQSHFGPAPDYSGQGTGDVQVTIPNGSTLTTMGNILKNNGVVKSVEAFTSAANKNPKGRSIQPGVYVLRKQMSASDAVTMMLDPKAQSTMIVAEGMRDKQIYDVIDKRLGLASGSTQKIAAAKWKTFGLPAWANSARDIKDPLEGFLFPSRYSVAKGMKPEDVLRQMVGQANEQFAKFDLAAEAKKQHLKSPLELLTVASLAQAEGKTDDDFRKMAKVVYNRMVLSNPETYGLLEFDSTYNYIKNASLTNINIDSAKALDDPYNTYKYKGLPPGPIGNPGLVALQAAMNPDPGNWYYFISLDNKTTKFTKTYAEFKELYAQYNAKKH